MAEEEDEGPKKSIFETIQDNVGLTWALKVVKDERERRQATDFQHPYEMVHNLVKTMQFEMVMGSLIVTNCVFIGIEASEKGGHNSDLYSACEHVFTALFLIEWILRVISDGWVWMVDFYNFCDFLLVFVTGVLTQWVMAPAQMDVEFLQMFTVLRALRLIRLARAVRLIPSFKEMWLLLRGLTDSLRTLFWTMVIIFCVLYVFAIAATEMIGKHESFQDDEAVQLLFGDLLKSMLTLLQVMTLDTWADTVARPVMDKLPQMAMFFVFFITVAVFVLMNVITAVIVENAFAIAKEDEEQQAKMKERQKAKELEALREMFMEIDEDGSGELTTEEFLAAIKNEKVKRRLMVLEMEEGELEEVWNILDNGDGTLTVDEFTQGLRKMNGEARSKDILEMLKSLRKSVRDSVHLVDKIENMECTLVSMHEDVGEVQRDMGILLQVCRTLQATFTQAAANMQQRPPSAPMTTPKAPTGLPTAAKTIAAG